MAGSGLMSEIESTASHLLLVNNLKDNLMVIKEMEIKSLVHCEIFTHKINIVKKMIEIEKVSP